MFKMFYTLSRVIKEEKKNEAGVRELEVKKRGGATGGRGSLATNKVGHLRGRERNRGLKKREESRGQK